MKRIWFLLILVLFFWWRGSYSMVLLDIKVEEGKKGKVESFSLIDQGTVELYDSLETSAFLGNFTLSAQAATFDSVNLTLDLSLFTLGPDIQSYFKEYLLKTGEETVLPELRVKDDILFRVKITPHIKAEETNRCNLNTKDAETWYSDPSTHFYYHYILETLPDYHWNTNKGVLEDFYHRIWDRFGFWDPDKIDYFLVPCELKEIYWDKRYGQGLDPTKRKIYVIYNQSTRSVDGPGVGMFLFYRYWGYAPAMVVEGATGNIGLAHYQAQKLKKRGMLFSLKELEISKDYKSKPKEIAFYQASSFIKYLVDTYGLGRFKKFYEEVTDLTFEQALFKVYGKKLPQLEKEWLAYLDTFKEYEANLVYFVTLKTQYRHYAEAIDLLNDLLEMSENKAGYLSDLAGIHYTLGDYEKAKEYYLKLLDLKPENPLFICLLGNTYNLLGDYGQAESLYVKAIGLDTSYITPLLKLGELYLAEGEYQKGKELFDKGLSKGPGTEEAALLFLGSAECKKNLGQPEEAQEDLEKGLYQCQVMLNSFPERPAPYYYSGKVYLAMGFPDTAAYYLETAATLEDIPYRRGKILLDLAGAYSAVGDLELAQKAYQEILDINCGAREKEQAEKLLAQPKERKEGSK
ncbi:MAG TPA: tetratricopeptide repeat protein [candidate division Zixibacteria bacterium]